MKGLSSKPLGASQKLSAFEKREEDYYNQVIKAIETLKAARERITQLKVCAIVGKASDTLRHYPKIRKIFDEIARSAGKRK